MLHSAQSVDVLLLAAVISLTLHARPVAMASTLTLSSATALPAEVQLSGAIVAAVEEDAEAQAARDEADAVQHQQVQEHMNWLALERMYNAIQGRGKLHKQRKMLKYLYPLLVGVVIAKAVLIPLVLKLLTALSTTSFVMSKIALIASGLLALRWIFAAPDSHDKTHFEIVHVPRPHTHIGGGGWDDLTLSGSNVVELTAAKQPRRKYIPIVPVELNNGFGTAAAAAAAANGGGDGGGFSGHDATGLYRYPQHSYIGATYEGKPFL